MQQVSFGAELDLLLSEIVRNFGVTNRQLPNGTDYRRTCEFRRACIQP